MNNNDVDPFEFDDEDLSNDEPLPDNLSALIQEALDDDTPDIPMEQVFAELRAYHNKYAVVIHELEGLEELRRGESYDLEDVLAEAETMIASRRSENKSKP